MSLLSTVCRTDKAMMNRNLSAVTSLRSEVFSLERELTKQRVKCRALEEELQNPLNIHRWRKLQVQCERERGRVRKSRWLEKV